MAMPARFLFDLDLSAQPVVEVPAEPEPSEPMITVAEHERLVAGAEARGRQAGIAEGQNAAEARAAAAIAANLAKVDAGISELLGRTDASLGEICHDATRLAAAVAHQLARTLVAREPLAEVEAILADCLGPLRKTPHLAVRLRAEDADELRDRIKAMAEERGFSGRLVILGEPDFAAGDCRVEWADGGIVRDMGRAFSAIEGTIDAHFAVSTARNDEDGQ